MSVSAKSITFAEEDKLTQDNWAIWKEAMMDMLPSFEVAGQEIMNGKRHNWNATKPRRKESVTEEVVRRDGSFKRVTREWAASDDSLFLKDFEEWKKDKKRYHVMEGILNRYIGLDRTRLLCASQ